MVKESIESSQSKPIKLSLINNSEYTVNNGYIILLEKEQLCCNAATD